MWKLNGHLLIVKLLSRKFKIINLEVTLEASQRTPDAIQTNGTAQIGANIEL